MLRIQADTAVFQDCQRFVWHGRSVEFALAFNQIAHTELEGIGLGSRTPVLVKLNQYPGESLGAESLIESCFGLCHVLILDR
jgi:hypothetical protein